MNGSGQRPIDATHDPGLRSWVDSANEHDTDFPIQNLPFAVFRRRHVQETPRIGIAIGDQILDLARCAEAKLLDGLSGAVREAAAAPVLNPLMTLGPEAMAELRPRLTKILAADGWGSDARLLVPIHRAQMHLPVVIREYTDFYASIHHATNVGRLFRPDNPLLPNYKHVPIAYHGRSSSIVLTGTPIRRPSGQIKRPGDTAPGRCRLEKRGRVMTGWAEIEVRPGPGGRTRAVWHEEVRVRFVPGALDGAVRLAGRYLFGRAMNRLLRTP